MMKDFNSPSVTARIKASKALKSPGFRRLCYGSISNNVEASIPEDNTENHPPSPVKLPEIREVFQKCRVYVEVKSGNDDRSGGIRNRLMKEGIEVDAKLNKGTTHVIFKDGLLSTYKQAKKQGISIVNLLWVDACLKQKRLVDTDKYQISNQDRYENPELYKKIRGVRKSMQLNIDCIDMLPPNTPDKFSKTSHETVDMNLTSYNDKKSSVTCTESAFMTPNQRTIVNATAMSIATPPQNSDVMSFVMSTPTQNTGEKKKIIFNSLSRVSSLGRRSVMDIALQRITENCNRSMSSLPEKDLMPTPKFNTSLRTQLSKRKILDITAGVQDDKENEKSAKIKEKKLPALKPNIRKQKTDVSKPPVKETTSRQSISQYFKPTAKKVSLKASKPSTPQLKRIVCTNMLHSEKTVLYDAIFKLGGVVDEAVTKHTTHVVSPTIDRTMNILRGVVRACIIVDVQWIHNSLAQNKFLDATLYQHVISDSNRFFERSILGPNFKNTTFSLAGLFYLSRESFDHPEKKYCYLREIIELCDGKVTDDVKLAKIIVNDGDTVLLKSLNPNAKQLKSSCIFDSAMRGKFIEL